MEEAEGYAMKESDDFYRELEMAVLKLDAEAHDCRVKISELRCRMDEACDQGRIPIQQWRKLLDKIADVQAHCVTHAPVAPGQSPGARSSP